MTGHGQPDARAPDAAEPDAARPDAARPDAQPGDRATNPMRGVWVAVAILAGAALVFIVLALTSGALG